MIAMLVCLLAMLGLQLMTPYWWWVMIVPFAYGAAVATSGWTGHPDGLLGRGASLARGRDLFLSHGKRSHRHADGRGCSGWASRG